MTGRRRHSERRGSKSALKPKRFIPSSVLRNSSLSYRTRSNSLDATDSSELRAQRHIGSLSASPETISRTRKKRRSSDIDKIGTDIVIPSAKRIPILSSIDEMAPEQQTMPSPQFATITEDIGFLDEEHAVICTEDSDDCVSTSCSIDGEQEDEYLENKDFQRLQHGLNDEQYMTKSVPPQLTITRCSGVGSPTKVWNLLCRKDEMIRPSHRLLDNHEDLNPRTRSVLLDWMMEVCDSEKQHRETYHLAVDYVDRFLTTFKNVRADTFQLVGTTALFLASKYEEIYPPKLEELVSYTDGACTEIGVRRFELVMLKHLEWSLSPVTSIHWLNVYMQLLGNKEITKNIGDKHVSQKPFTIPEYMREDFVHMAKVLDLVLLDVESLKYSYREMAAAVLFACYEPHALFQQVTGYSYEELIKVVEWVEPAVKVCDSHRATGDPMPILDGIRADDLHNIQTHPAADFDDLLKMVFEERTHVTCSRKRISSIRKRGPLLPRCGNPD